MRKAALVCAFALSLGLLSACSLPRDPQMQSRADEMSPCDKIDTLLGAYSSHFDAIKGPVLSQRYLDIWAAKVDAVGRGCQIWKSGQHSTYMCTRNAPNRAVADEWYDKASAVMQQCLPDWQQQSADNSERGIEGTVWTSATRKPTVGLQLVATGGNHWVLYYFIGDRDKWF